MKTTVKCEECEKTFTKETSNKAEQALRMHVGRSHSGNIRVPKRRRKPAFADGSGNGVPLLASGKPDRRTKAWKEAHPRRLVADAGGEAGACFCPRCGLNLAALTTALRVAQNMTRA